MNLQDDSLINYHCGKLNTVLKIVSRGVGENWIRNAIEIPCIKRIIRKGEEKEEKEGEKRCA